MFGANPKPRKLTTYGKAHRHQATAFKTFLETSPEKRKSNVSGNVAESKKTLDEPVDLQASRGRTRETEWDIPSDEDIGTDFAKPTRSKSPKKTTSKNSPKLVKPSAGDRKTATEQESSNEHRPAAMKGLGSSQVRPRQQERADIFDFPADDVEDFRQPVSLPPLPTRDKPRPPPTKTKVQAQAQKLRSRATTPELVQNTVDKPPTKRKSPQHVDIFDVPDDEDAAMSPQPPARKRQKTPALSNESERRFMPPSRAAKVERPDVKKPPAGQIKSYGVRSPHVSSSHGIVKRKLHKGSSAPASLFNMVREPPSPPDESSSSAGSPGSPDFGTVMDLDSTIVPATPPDRASESPAAVSGSVTPRQRQLWTQLLDESSVDSPSELPISRLKLTSTIKKSTQKLAGLTRASSDIPRSTYTKRTRLIDSLKAKASDAVDEEMDLDDVSEMSAEDRSGRVESLAKSRTSPPKLKSESSFKKISAKVTYGQGRTYLEEKNEEKMWDMLVADEPSQSSNGQSRSQEPLEDEMDMDEGSQLRAAHDLRAAGSKKRLRDELSMLLMDIEQQSNSLSVRRAALRDIGEMLMKREAATCFLESALEAPFLDAVANDVDPISNFTGAAVLVLLMAAEPSVATLDTIFNSKLFGRASTLLTSSLTLERLLKQKELNMSRMSQSTILDFRDSLFEHDLWGSPKPRSLTPRVLGLRLIEMVVRSLRKHGSSYTLLEEGTVNNILTIACTEANSQSPDLAVLELAMSALQVNTVSTGSNRHKLWPAALLKVFADSLPQFLELDSEASTLTKQLALKLAVELTTADPNACKIIGTPTLLNTLFTQANIRFRELLNHQTGDAYSIALDFTVLSFGLTIGLAEASDETRLATLNHDAGAQLRTSIRLFVQAKNQAADADSLEDTQMNVVYGCLAFTLGNLSRNAVVRDFIRKQLPGNSMESVIAAMQEFAAINQLTDKREFEGEEGYEVSRGFTEHLKGVLREVREVNGV